ncbi:MAG: hypothetical protein GXP05_03950 [Alphaproteobacteria bacterium]|nr:hypothetical protein [Alphaproteobacteria bacterium]
MAIWHDIVDTYLFPARVARRNKGAIAGEPTLLAYLLLAALVSLFSRLPDLVSQDLGAEAVRRLIAAQFATSMLFGPLFFYFIAIVSRFIAYLVGGKGTGAGARYALFWPLVALQPVVILIEIARESSLPPLVQAVISGLGAIFFLYVWLTFLIVMERPSAEKPASQP